MAEEPDMGPSVRLHSQYDDGDELPNRSAFEFIRIDYERTGAPFKDDKSFRLISREATGEEIRAVALSPGLARAWLKECLKLINEKFPEEQDTPAEVSSSVEVVPT